MTTSTVVLLFAGSIAGLSYHGGVFNTGAVDTSIGIGGEDTVVTGSLDPTIVDAVIKRHLAQFQYCYERELASNPKLAGKIVMTFTIEGDGRVSHASPTSSTMVDPVVEGCISSRLLTTLFPKPKGGGIVAVSYPFLFKDGRVLGTPRVENDDVLVGVSKADDSDLKAILGRANDDRGQSREASQAMGTRSSGPRGDDPYGSQAVLDSANKQLENYNPTAEVAGAVVETLMEWGVVWIALSALVGVLSRSRGQGFASGFLWSILLSPLVGATVTLVRKRNPRALEAAALSAGSMKKCPFCAELIKPEATVCRFCQREQPAGAAAS